MNRFRNTERGQALAFLAIGFAALISFAALAIDGGMVYAERRQSQNAADSSALAAALAMVNSEDLYAAGLSRALSNSYNNDGASNTVEVYNPPISGQFAGNSEYVQVFITANVNTSLLHFVYGGAMQNTVEAIARAVPGQVGALYNGNAIVGLRPTGCSSVRKTGNSDTDLFGGGIWSNSNDENCSFRYDGAAGDLTVESGYAINIVGGRSDTHDPNATVVEGVPQYPYPPLVDVPAPTCGSAATWDGGTNIMTPGEWTGEFPPHGDVFLEPGIYCVTDTSVRVNAHDVLAGDDVLIYMQAGGTVHWNGNAEINLSGRTSGTYEGLLWYVSHGDYTNPGGCDVQINGNESSYFEGTFYAPACDIDIQGNGQSTGWHSQIIGYQVEMQGNADLVVQYVPDENYEANLPPEIELSK